PVAKFFAPYIATEIMHHVRTLGAMTDRLAQHRRDDAIRRPLHQLERERAADAITEEDELADAEGVHQAQLVVRERPPRVSDGDRAGGFGARAVALGHGDAAEVGSEIVPRVDHRVGPIADAGVQSATRCAKQRKSGAGVLVTNAHVALLVELKGSA